MVARPATWEACRCILVARTPHDVLMLNDTDTLRQSDCGTVDLSISSQYNKPRFPRYVYTNSRGSQQTRGTLVMPPSLYRLRRARDLIIQFSTYFDRADLAFRQIADANLVPSRAVSSGRANTDVYVIQLIVSIGPRPTIALRSLSISLRRSSYKAFISSYCLLRRSPRDLLLQGGRCKYRMIECAIRFHQRHTAAGTASLT